MKDLFFKRTNHYTSNLMPEEIQTILLSLIKKSSETEYSFSGKIEVSKFTLTPILGTRENFKLLILGELKSTTKTHIDIDYTVSFFLKLYVYAQFVAALILLFVLRLNKIHIDYFGLKHPEYLLVVFASVFFLICIGIFNSQYYYYSKLLERTLQLE